MSAEIDQCVCEIVDDLSSAPNSAAIRNKWRRRLIEPAVFVLLFGLNLSGTVFKNQIIYQTCVVTFGYGDDVCRLLGTASARTSDEVKRIEQFVQPYAADILLAKTLIESVVPALAGMFIGPWSDKFGRRPLLIISFLGFSLIYIITCLISILSTKYTISPWYYLLAVIPESILGGNCVFTIATFCYIADTTTMEQRPFRMAILEGCIYGGLMAGSFAAGLIFAVSNAVTVFAISAGVITLATIYIIAFVEESLTMQDNEGQVQELFTLRHIKLMCAVCFQRREHYDRAVIWMIIVTLACWAFVIDGQGVVLYLFLREKLQWTVTEFTTYETVGILVPMIGNVLGICLLRKLLDMSAISLALVACGSSLLNTVVKATASVSWHLYLAIGLGALKPFGIPMCRTILSNIVPTNELGKVFSFTNVIESVAPFVAAPLYTTIYTSTLCSDPATFMYFSVLLYFLAYILLVIVFGLRHGMSFVYAPIL